MTRLDEIKEQLKKVADIKDSDYLFDVCVNSAAGGGYYLGGCYVDTHEQADAAQQFVTEARANVGWLVEQLEETQAMLRTAAANCSPIPPSSFTAHGPGSDHWIALSEAGKPKSIKGCGCRLNGECVIKGDWAPGESASCDECRYQTTDQTDPQPNKPSTVCPHCYEAGHMVCVAACHMLGTTKVERDARWEENQRQMYARKKKGD